MLCHCVGPVSCCVTVMDLHGVVSLCMTCVMLCHCVGPASCCVTA